MCSWLVSQRSYAQGSNSQCAAGLSAKEATLKAAKANVQLASQLKKLR
jgi:hypothetical protein